MNPQRIALKLYTKSDLSLSDMPPFIGVFHRFIQEAAVPGLLIDVADYAHVPDGPGVILIGHDIDYGVDRTEGRSGLLTVRKRAGGQDAETLLRSTLGMAVATARAIEADDAVSATFVCDELMIAFPDRLAAPNNAEAAELLRKDLAPALSALFGEGASVAYDSADDPRRMLTLRLSGGDASLASLIEKTEQA